MTMKLQGVLALALFTGTFLSGGVTTHASEVVGTLSSDSSAVSVATSGVVVGTVTEVSNGGGGSNGGGSGGGNSGGGSLTVVSPTGEVLGATTSNIPSPAFPNAGESVDLSQGATWFAFLLGGLAVVAPFFIRRKRLQ